MPYSRDDHLVGPGITKIKGYVKSKKLIAAVSKGELNYVQFWPWFKCIKLPGCAWRIYAKEAVQTHTGPVSACMSADSKCVS